MSVQDLLTPENAALVLIDHNIGTSLSVESVARQTLVNNVVALAEVGRLFGLPIVLTNGQDEDASGMLYPELTAVVSDTAVIRRYGTMNSWDDARFRDAIEATGRRKLIVAGLYTEVCVLFPVLSVLAEGYEVYVVVDASAGESQVTQEAAIGRMVQAGALPVTWFSLAAELQRSWANADTAQEFAAIAGRRMAGFGLVNSYHYAPKAVGAAS